MRNGVYCYASGLIGSFCGYSALWGSSCYYWCCCWSSLVNSSLSCTTSGLNNYIRLFIGPSCSLITSWCFFTDWASSLEWLSILSSYSCNLFSLFPLAPSFSTASLKSTFLLFLFSIFLVECVVGSILYGCEWSASDPTLCDDLFCGDFSLPNFYVFIIRLIFSYFYMSSK